MSRRANHTPGHPPPFGGPGRVSALRKKQLLREAANRALREKNNPRKPTGARGREVMKKLRRIWRGLRGLHTERALVKRRRWVLQNTTMVADKTMYYIGRRGLTLRWTTSILSARQFRFRATAEWARLGIVKKRRRHWWAAPHFVNEIA